MSRKKVNPRRVPISKSAVQKAKDDTTEAVTARTWSIFFTALRDKEGYGVKRLIRIWDAINEHCEVIQRQTDAGAIKRIISLTRTMSAYTGLQFPTWENYELKPIKTQADLKSVAKKSARLSEELVYAICFTVMHEVEGYGRERILRLSGEMEELNDSIKRKYISVQDLMRTLDEEAGIRLN